MPGPLLERDPTIQKALLQRTPPREGSRQLSSTNRIPEAPEFPASRLVAVRPCLELEKPVKLETAARPHRPQGDSPRTPSHPGAIPQLAAAFAGAARTGAHGEACRAL